MKSAETMLDEIEEAAALPPERGGAALSEWEESFVESLREQLDAGRQLSDRQLAKLQEIYDR
jgi:hypothetical protein